MANEVDPPSSGAREPILAGVCRIKVIEKDAEQIFFFSNALLEKHAPNFPQHSTQMAEIATFEAFTLWLNEKDGGYELRDDLFDISDIFYNTSTWDAITRLIKIYSFGTRMQVPELSNDAFWILSSKLDIMFMQKIDFSGMSAPRRQNEARDALNAVRCIYANTSRTCVLRKRTVNEFCGSNITTSLNSEGWLHRFPPTFLADIIIRKTELASLMEDRSDLVADFGTAKRRKI